MLIDFIIIGAMKCGTSSLYRYIESHPLVIPSKPKETHFFSKNNKYSKGIEHYQNLFRGNGKYRFEASPSYAQRHIYPYTAEHIYINSPDTKIIYLVRDPIERIKSHYIHNFACSREKLPFNDIINNLDNNNYILTSMYYYQLQAYLEYFPKSNIMVVQSETLKSKTADVLNSIFAFLDIEPDYDPSLLQTHYHQSDMKRKSGYLERRLMSRINNTHIKTGIKKLKCFMTQPLERPELTEMERQMLHDVFYDDITNLRRFTKMPFKEWDI